MNIKKRRLLLTLCALSPIGMGNAVKAMSPEQWNCAITEEVNTPAMMDMAYRFEMPPENDFSKKNEERDGYYDKIERAVAGCLQKYNWSNDELRNNFHYVTSGLALLGATSRLIDAGVDVTPLRSVVENLTDAEWSAYESSNINISKPVADKLSVNFTKILLGQGFETRPTEKSYNKNVDSLATNYFTYSYMSRKNQVLLGLLDIKKAAVIAKENEDYTKWSELIVAAEKSNDIAIEKWNNAMTQPTWSDTNRCVTVYEVTKYISNANLDMIEANRIDQSKISAENRQFAFDFKDKLRVFQNQTFDYLSDCDNKFYGWRRTYLGKDY